MLTSWRFAPLRHSPNMGMLQGCEGLNDDRSQTELRLRPLRGCHKAAWLPARRLARPRMARSVSFLQELIRIPPVGRRHRHPQPRKGVKRRELHICVLRRDGLSPFQVRAKAFAVSTKCRKVEWGYGRILVRDGANAGWINSMLKDRQKSEFDGFVDCIIIRFR